MTWEILMKRFWFEGLDLIFRSLGWGIFFSSCGTKTNLNRQRVFIMCGSVRQFLWQIAVSKVSQVRVYNQSRRHNLIRWLQSGVNHMGVGRGLREGHSGMKIIKLTKKKNIEGWLFMFCLSCLAKLWAKVHMRFYFDPFLQVS